ncbi:MAG TPA: phosphoribosylglycinamide formyltransferase [Candidatus Kapabacteria bacterium]|nr:phosphoribosylglycinamide formyltransferase [Candidatus Kapabacteria bacterium]
MSEQNAGEPDASEPLASRPHASEPLAGEPVRIAVMASGRGSNFRAIDERLSSMSAPPARIVLCLSNNPSPGAFDYARERGIPAMRLSPKMFEREEDYAAALDETLERHGIELIVLAGYMRKIPARVVERFTGRILNIHPALLPEFGGEGMYGMHVHEAVIAAGARESGASVHLVDGEYDTGAVIASERIAIAPDETPASLAERVLEVEHRLYPRVVIEWAERLRAARESAH